MHRVCCWLGGVVGAEPGGEQSSNASVLVSILFRRGLSIFIQEAVQAIWSWRARSQGQR